MRIRALRNSKKKESFLIEEGDITHLSIHGKTVSIHIGSDEFILPTSFDDWVKCLEPLGLTQVDRNCAVINNKIRNIDLDDLKVYFVDRISHDSKYATISNARFSGLKDSLKNMLHKNKQSKLE
ncbi:LytTR family transcriptional regulator DNA-binding domain-containing protein [Paenibacillus psychroresistens]|uniref:LytTR family transcriptional regulator DNA-binding domain-containing protein n=1 Tax=Paenibacillus psychroresistens TaxID=1778678 RepID=UPI001391EFF1|nr:LytTR family transcriptional regulator DNA-binding domain-containing protein [Paenibacillus psychroresistens]